MLRIEAVAHNTQELNCRRSLEMFPEVVSRLKAILERFADALSCIDQCFIADEMLERLPLASQVGKTRVGGIDLNKARMRQVIEALIALSPSPKGFTASDVAARVRVLSNQSPYTTAPDTQLMISRSFVANRSFAGSVTPADTNRSQPGSEQ